LAGRRQSDDNKRLRIARSEYAGLVHLRQGEKSRFNGIGGDVLALGCFENVLYAAGDPQVSVDKLARVTGMEIPIPQDVSCQGGILVVPGHHPICALDDLSGFRYDADLFTGIRYAGGTKADIVRRIEGEHIEIFTQSVPLPDADPQPVKPMEE